MSATKTIVVGVDGSAGSREALDYALDEAVLRDSSVRVVTVFDSLAAFGARYGIPVPVSDPDLADRVQSQTQALVDQALAGRQACPEVRVSVHSDSNPARVLVQEAEHAELLVVGHRGRGSFTSTLLGSIGLQCVPRASCPTTVVRPLTNVRSEQSTPEERVSVP